MARKKAQLDQYPDAPLLHDGSERMKGHLTWLAFSGQEARRTLAVKAAALAAHLRATAPLDLAATRYTGSTDQFRAPKSHNPERPPQLAGRHPQHQPESYHYWLLDLQTLG